MLSSPVMTFKRSFLQFLTDRYSTVFLILGQHSRHKLRCNPTHVQLFCENSLTRSITNSNLCTEIVYGTTTILVDSRPYVFHYWGGCCRAWPTWSIIISNRKSAILETYKSLKSFATAHARITRSLFQHFKSFTSRFTQSHTELDAHALFVNFRHTTDITKSQTADAIHTKTRATIKRFYIKPRHSARSLTRHHRNTP